MGLENKIMITAFFIVACLIPFALGLKMQGNINRAPIRLRMDNASNTNLTEKLSEECWTAVEGCSENLKLLKLYQSLGRPCVAGVEPHCVNTTACTGDDRLVLNRTICEEKGEDDLFGKAMLKIKPKCKKIVGKCLDARPNTEELMKNKMFCEVMTGKADVTVDDVTGDDVISCLIETSRRGGGKKNSGEKEESEEEEDSEDSDEDDDGNRRRRRAADDDSDESDVDEDENESDENENGTGMDCTMEEIFSLKDAAKCTASCLQVGIITLLLLLGVLLEVVL